MPEEFKAVETSMEDSPHLLHISYSQINTYLRCPRRYKYEYVMVREWEELPSSLPFGRAIHTAVADYYRSLQVEDVISLKQMFSSFEKRWKFEIEGFSVKFRKDEDEGSLFELASKMLRVFRESVRPPQNIEAVEMPFSVGLVDQETGDILPFKLIGIIDLLESDHEGNLSIGELKTASRRPTEEQTERELQATIYSYALKQMGYTTSKEGTLVRFDFLIKKKEPTLETYYVVKNERNHRKLFYLAKQILRAVDLGIYYPNGGWYCADCPFKNACENDL